MRPIYFFCNGPRGLGLAGFFTIKGVGHQVLSADNELYYYEDVDLKSMKSLVKGFSSSKPSTAGAPWKTCTESEFLAFCRTLQAFVPPMDSLIEEALSSADERQVEMLPETSAWIFQGQDHPSQSTMPPRNSLGRIIW